MRRLSVAYLADYYIAWMGGAAILAAMLNSVLRAAPAQNAGIHVLFSARHLPPELQRETRDFLPLRREQVQATGPMRALIEGVPGLQTLIFHKDLAATLAALEVQVIGPTGSHPGAAVRQPWFAYLPDFQHQYLPHFFSAAERHARDAHLRAMVEGAHAVFVNAAAVAADVQRFYPAAARSRRIHRIPQLYPDLGSAFEDRRAEVQARHGITAPYLLSCSQRWQHKQHELVIAAYAEHRRSQANAALQLVFTGELTDHRNPGYAQAIERQIDALALRPQVRQLGLLPRDEQLQLVAGACAVVQASQFEGGPGASGTLEAALLGTPVIASDIDTNRELKFGAVHLFDPQRPGALAQAFDAVAASTPGSAADRRPFDLEQIEYLSLASGLEMLATLRSALG
ncbi:MAG: glycosyltransferase [Burkholderiales bacterium]|nr:glycosyltransferase [Burkholderiales bacterium]